MVIEKRLRVIEAQQLASDEKLNLEEIPETATLVEAQRIYDGNLRKLYGRTRRNLCKKQFEDVGPPMTLEEATRIYGDNLKSFPGNRKND